MSGIKKIWSYVYLSPFVLFYAIRMLFNSFHNKKIYILNTPLHGNLGDQAILLSERKILKDVLPEYKAIIIPNKLCKDMPKVVARVIGNDPVCLHGGGYLGDLWPNEDMTIRKILEVLNKNKILFFPQTFCSNDVKDYFEKVRPIFEKNGTLTFFARDLYSYEELKKNLKNRVFYSPDIVLYEHRKRYVKKNVITTCFRNDTEKTMMDDVKTTIMGAIKGSKIQEIDTVTDKIILYYNRTRNIKMLMNKIGESKLLITDRLHGMIFAYLTMTPCLVFNSKSPKIKGVYKWLSKSDYIAFHDDDKDIAREINEMLNREYIFNESVNRSDFDELKNNLVEITK